MGKWDFARFDEFSENTLCSTAPLAQAACHYDNIIMWKLIPHYQYFLSGFHQSQVGPPHKGNEKWKFILMFIKKIIQYDKG